MAIIPNTGGPTVSENSGELDAKFDDAKKFAQEWVNADFHKASEDFMQWFWMQKFDPERELAAEELVAAEVLAEVDPDIALLDDLDAAFTTGEDTWADSLEGDESLDESINFIHLNEHPIAPFIERLVQDDRLPDITEEIWFEWLTRLSAGEEFDSIISGDESLSDGMKRIILDRFESIQHSDENIAEANISSFRADFWDELTVVGEEITVSEDRLEAIIAEIWAVYITGNDPEEKEVAFEMAISTAINTNLFTVQESFHRTVEFEVLFQNVKNPDLSLKARISAYSDVLDILYTDTGAKGGRRQRENEASMRRLQLRNSGMQERYEAAIIELQNARESENILRATQLEEEVQQIIDLTRGILDTPIWNFDIALDGEQQLSENSGAA